MAQLPKKVIEYRVYDLPFEFPALLLSGDEWRISDVMSNRLHFHNCIEIGFCHSHGGTLVFEGERVPFREGDITIIPRHVPHTTCSQKGTRSMWSYIFLDLNILIHDMLPVESSPDLSPPDPSVLQCLYSRDRHPRIHFLATSLLSEMQGKRSNWTEVTRGLLLVLYYELARLKEKYHRPESDLGKKSFVLKPVLEYIHSNYMNPISMKELADMCHLSETHFRRIFLSIMGTSPLSFINTTRISQACIMLLTTDKSILAIAEAVGINSISSFNRNFYQIMGATPREYRNATARSSLVPHQKYVLTYKGWLTPEITPEYADAELSADVEFQP